MKSLKSLILSESWFNDKIAINTVPDINIKGISSHSAHIKDDFLFIATKKSLHGLSDGHDYIDMAINNGAKAIVVDKEFLPKKAYGLPLLAIKDSKTALSYFMESFYDFPSKHIKLIGITGTNGKTSTSFMLYSILTQAGYHTKIMGTLGHGYPHKLHPTTHTTMEPEYLSSCLASFVKEGVSHVVMEVSSHALALKRVEALRFAAVGLSNITEDHLDFHDSIKDYQQAKERLFTDLAGNETPKTICFNHPFLHISHLQNITFYGSEHDPIFASHIDLKPDSLAFLLHSFDQIKPINLPFSGVFQVANALLASSIALSLGIDLKHIVDGLEHCPMIPGRFQPIPNAQGLRIFIDYAHTPDGLKSLLNTAKALSPLKLIVVFGCAGNRDQQKRPLMGKIAQDLADIVIVTDDNPRNEDPHKIREDIIKGMNNNKAINIGDRYQAILYALSKAKKNDVIVIAGKGHEQYQIYGDEVRSFNDALAVREALAHYANKS